MRERVRNFIELCGVESRFVCIDEHGLPKSALIGDATTQPLSGLGGINGRITQGSDARRQSVATLGWAGLICETPLGFCWDEENGRSEESHTASVVSHK